MTGTIELMANQEIGAAVTNEQPSTERVLSAAIIKSVAVSVPLAIVFFLGLLALAVHDQNPNWTAMLSMAVGLGLLAGVFFGVLVGFMRTAHLFD